MGSRASARREPENRAVLFCPAPCGRPLGTAHAGAPEMGGKQVFLRGRAGGREHPRETTRASTLLRSL